MKNIGKLVPDSIDEEKFNEDIVALLGRPIKKIEIQDEKNFRVGVHDFEM